MSRARQKLLFMGKKGGGGNRERRGREGRGGGERERARMGWNGSFIEEYGDGLQASCHVGRFLDTERYLAAAVRLYGP